MTPFGSLLEKKLTTHFNGPGGGLEVLRIALPLVVSQACDTVMMFTDRLFLSKLGPAQMSAAMAGGLTCFTFVTFFMGLIGYSTALVARNFGARQTDNCAVVTAQTVFIALIAYPVILLCMPLGLLIFNRAGISPEQLSYQVPYFKILLFGTITTLLRTGIGSFFSGIGKTRIIMTANVAGMVCNVGINYILIFGKLGFPAMGIRGAAYGTIISGTIGVVVLCIAYLRES
ncbi:MAG: MATE family efflux transporter, partial [Chitinivibrionales bacterium]